MVNSDSGYIGRHPESTGVATVSGEDSAWNNLRDLFLGGTDTSDGGTGDLVVNGEGLVNVGNDMSSFSLGGTVTVSDTGTGGNLWVRNGSTISNGFGLIGRSTGSMGEATVTGSGSLWNNSTNLQVGSSGDGTLNIEAEGMVSSGGGNIGRNLGSTGVATVTGIGSQWNSSGVLYVGRQGDGTLNIEAGGVVDSAAPWIGHDSGSTGAATVTGGGSQMIYNNTVRVGIQGSGTLTIEAGGVVGNSGGIIGGSSGGSGVAIVTGSGSQWNIINGLVGVTVGHLGDGTLIVEAGGVVSKTNTRDTFIGRYSGSTGVATVTGSGSQWNNSENFHLGGDSIKGNGGTGELTVQDNGLVSVANTLKIWGPGTLNLDGGTIQAGTLDHTGSGTFNFLDGTLSVDTFDGDLTQNGGMLVIGSSPGITDVTGAYNQVGGALEIELYAGAGGSPVAGTDFDQLTADSVTLAGTLDLSVDPGYSPTLGDMFSIVNTTSGVAGTFSEVDNVYLSGGFTVDVIYGANDVTLEVIATLLGDFNLDGSVDGNDLTDPVDGWEVRYSVDLDGGDFLDWQRNFGAVAPLAAESTSVPEPSSFALIAVGLLGMSYRCRKQP